MLQWLLKCICTTSDSFQAMMKFHLKLIKLFTVVISFFAISRPFEHSLMFADKVRSLPKSGVNDRCSTWIGYGLTSKH